MIRPEIPHSMPASRRAAFLEIADIAVKKLSDRSGRLAAEQAGMEADRP